MVIKCDIYQGDAFSLLLFCIGLNPLSQAIIRSGYEHKFKNETTISHFSYMDDIKLYAKGEWDNDSFIHLIRIYSEDTGMPFRLEKYIRMVVKKGEIYQQDGIIGWIAEKCLKLVLRRKMIKQKKYHGKARPSMDCNIDK